MRKQNIVDIVDPVNGPYLGLGSGYSKLISNLT